jgi:predicted transcriptional regulator
MLRSAIPLGKILGIDLRVHVTFPLLLAASLIYSLATTGSAWRGAGLWGALLFAVVVREVARTIAVAFTNLRLRALFLLPVGGVMALVQRDPRDPNAAILPNPVRLLAPLANVAMGLLLIALTYAIDPHVKLFADPWISPAHILRSFVWMQFVMAAINMLPTNTLPSRQLFRASGKMTPGHRGVRASGTRTASPIFGLSTGLALALLLSGFLLMTYWPVNLWLMLAGGFLLLTAHMRASKPLNESDKDSILVRDVMLTEFTLLSSSDTLSGALAQTVHSLQDVFPVVRGHVLVGAVSRQTIADSLNSEGDSYLQSVMERRLHLTSPAEKVAAALGRAGSVGAHEFIPVVEEDLLLGILTPQSLSRAIHQVKLARLRSALQERD